MTDDTLWTVENRDGKYTRDTTLWLEYEVAGSIMGDDYSLNDMSPDEMFREYVREFTDSKLDSENDLPSGYAHITWSVIGKDLGPELAPFQPDRWPSMPEYEDYLTFFKWPVNAATGERADFLTMPVRSMQWNRTQRDRGGFIEEATGWKPAALQPCVFLPGVLAAYDHANRQ
jgi:hypothetical protein